MGQAGKEEQQIYVLPVKSVPGQDHNCADALEADRSRGCSEATLHCFEESEYSNVSSSNLKLGRCYSHCFNIRFLQDQFFSARSPWCARQACQHT